MWNAEGVPSRGLARRGHPRPRDIPGQALCQSGRGLTTRSDDHFHVETTHASPLPTFVQEVRDG
jgi:hypothetical protein